MVFTFGGYTGAYVEALAAAGLELGPALGLARGPSWPIPCQGGAVVKRP
jgi:hypothetical protein